MIPKKLTELLSFNQNSPIELVDQQWLNQYQVSIYFKRDDLIDPIISGNKFRKLKYVLADFLQSDKNSIISFGGPWSNHLHALAHLCSMYDIPLVAVIRGQEPAQLSATLEDIKNSGATLVFVSRREYRELRELTKQDNDSSNETLQRYPEHYIIPEGGLMSLALQGVTELATEIPQEYDYVYLPCGTATTLAGLCLGFSNNTRLNIIAVAALRAGKSLEKNVHALLDRSLGQDELLFCHWKIEHDFHFGGFAKTDQKLIQFMNEFYRRTKIMTEPVYTGKTLFALYDAIEKGRIPRGSKVLFIHTGGLQGLRGFKDCGFIAP